MTDRLKAELQEVIREHKAIVAALAKLASAAKEENESELRRFADKLMLLAQMEEEILIRLQYWSKST